jgi:hypothetical protein
MVGDKELRERSSGNNKWWINLCDHSASIKSERNFSDYSNGINSINSVNVYDVYNYGYVTWHRSNLNLNKMSDFLHLSIPMMIAMTN